jgi:hypothetical protein
MNRLCLLCDSRAVLTKEAAMGLAVVIGLADGALRKALNTQERTQDRPGYHLLMSGLAALAPAYPSTLRAAEDVAKFHFGGFNCLCLRCGALFDDEEEASAQAPAPP